MIQLVAASDLLAFAAERPATQDAGINRLLPVVEAWLEDFGNEALRSEVVNATGDIWYRAYREQTDRVVPAPPEFARFRESIGESLTMTTEPTSPPDPVQVERIATWLSVSAINSGFSAGYAAAGGVRVQWVTMADSAVRDTHRAADGQTRTLGDTFDIGGFDLLYPGDPVGPPSIWINCRCILAPAGRRGAAVTAALELVEDPDVVIEDDIDIEDEDLVDDLPDEIPVHGVATIEGSPTGDGRMFKLNGLTNRPLPLPLRYEFVGTHGGDTSNVAVVGRIDEMWREPKDAINEYRYRGVIFAHKAHAMEALEGIIDESMTGVSVEVDNIVLDPDHEALKAANLEEAMDASDPSLIDYAVQNLNVFSEARICGFTMVPIPAYMEAFIGLGHEFKEELSEEDAAALAACGCGGGDEVDADEFRDVSTDERKKLADEGKAMPDGSFPIANVADLKNAIQAIGRAKDPDAAKAFIKKRARELGAEELIPEEWALLRPYETAVTTASAFGGVTFTMNTGGGVGGGTGWTGTPRTTVSFAPGTKDGPGWITHPRATGRIRRYWVRGPGAAKIKWGVPGDFDRCRRQLVKYVKNPDWLAGLCANMHKEAIGVWPGQEAGGRGRHALIAAGGKPADLFTMTAAAAPAVAPEAWFEDPKFSGPTPLHVDLDTGRVYGHLATWGVCHIGIPGVCTTAPHSVSNYAFFRTGMVRTEEGTDVPVGHITIATGHAPIKASAQAAAAHYDNTGTVVADIAAGEDSHGIWIAGALRAGVDLDIATTLKAAALSGDWRTIRGSLELVGALAVNIPGFPIPRVSLAASAERQESLVAAGLVVQDGELAAAGNALGADEIAAITRNVVAELRYQEKRESRLAALKPLRDEVRMERIAAARAAAEED